jgi:hypothetical protein
MLVLKILAEQLFISGDKMKRLVPNAVPITFNYEEITLWEEISKISNDETITGENLLVLKTNIEMRMGIKLQELGWDLVVKLDHSYLTNANPMTGLVDFDFFHQMLVKQCCQTVVGHSIAHCLWSVSWPGK